MSLLPRLSFPCFNNVKWCCLTLVAFSTHCQQGSSWARFVCLCVINILAAVHFVTLVEGVSIVGIYY